MILATTCNSRPGGPSRGHASSSIVPTTCRARRRPHEYVVGSSSASKRNRLGGGLLDSTPPLLHTRCVALWTSAVAVAAAASLRRISNEVTHLLLEVRKPGVSAIRCLNSILRRRAGDALHLNCLSRIFPVQVVQSHAGDLVRFCRKEYARISKQLTGTVKVTGWKTFALTEVLPSTTSRNLPELETKTIRMMLLSAHVCIWADPLVNKRG